MHINMLVNMNPLGRPLGRFRKETVAVSGHSDRDYRSHVRQGRSCADGIGRRAEFSHEPRMFEYYCDYSSGTVCVTLVFRSTCSIHLLA